MLGKLRLVFGLMKGLWLLPAFIVCLVMLHAAELPFNVDDPYTQMNFDQVRNWKSLVLYDCGIATLTAGSTFVDLNVNYVTADTFVAFVVPSLTSMIDSTDTVNFYHAVKIDGNTIEIVAISPLTGHHDYADNSTVLYLTFLRDR